MDNIKVGIVGYGTIGKRVADAVLLQDDMELVGVTANTYNYRIKSAHAKGIKIFPVSHSVRREIIGCYYDIDVIGNMDCLVEQSDVIVDCTPKGVGSHNKELYKRLKTKAVFQGGEPSSIGSGFVAQCNYQDVLGEDFIRVVSCNTTGLCRTLAALNSKYGVDKVHATMIRRAADPWDIYHGPINALVPHLVVPSHHGPDVNTILPDIEIFTTSISVPTTLMHMHSLAVDLDPHEEPPPTVENIASLFQETTRVRVVHNSDGIRSTAEILEYAKDLGRSRGDMPEVCVWSDTIGVWNNKVMYLQAVHQESNVIPENIDAIRACVGSVMPEESIQKTNASLRI